MYLGVLGPDDDPFLAGAYFALSWSTSTLFGDLLGPAFLDEILSLEVLTDGVWQPA